MYVILITIVFVCSVSGLERAAALDLDEEEGESVLEDHYDYVKEWLGELPRPVYSPELIPLSCSNPVFVPSCNVVVGTTSAEPSQPGPSGDHSSSQLVAYT